MDACSFVSRRLRQRPHLYAPPARVVRSEVPGAQIEYRLPERVDAES
jgi:hypothetical protein